MTIQHKKLINVYDRRILFNKYRKNTPSVIFIAGLGDSHETWKKVQERISE